MNKPINFAKIFVVAFFGLGGFLAVYQYITPSGPASGPGNTAATQLAAQPVRSITVPPLSLQAARGQQVFDKNCAECHGKDAQGTQKGPTFIDEIYNPGHHADEAFFRAAANGVRQHHWPFGDMPAQHQVSTQEIADIVAYVRALQKANGIVYQQHTM